MDDENYSRYLDDARKPAENHDSRKHPHAYVNAGLEKTPSIYTIDTDSSQWKNSLETMTTDTRTPPGGRRGSQETTLTTDSSDSRWRRDSLLNLDLIDDGDGTLAVWKGTKTTMAGSFQSEGKSTDDLVIEDSSSGSSDSLKSEDRETWDNKAQYILAVVGYAVGLGNVWRFPYLLQKNGGGAFLIPYVIMLVIEGIPIFYLELAVGQRLRKGAIGAWNQISPYLGGIGIASAFVSFWVALYYNTIIAWCLVYLVQSFQAKLPWSDCPGYPGGLYGNETIPVQECNISSPTIYFWYRTTLNISPSVEEGGSLNWWIIVSLLSAWLIVFLCMIKGIASSGKVVYVTATFPYLVLIIFFFRGVTLDGFYHGLEHMFVPEFARLGDPQVWLEAATQIFFSLGLAFGSLIAFSSYMPVRNNCYRDAILVSLVNCGTSVFAGIVIFSILGFKATVNYDNCVDQRNMELISLFNTSDITPPPSGSLTNFTTYVAKTDIWITSVGKMPNITSCDMEEELGKSASGTGLAFIAFTEAINQFPAGAPVWAILFFLMLLTLGLDSMFGTLEGVVTSIMDMNLISGNRKEFVTATLCLVSLLLSFCFANQAGPYIFTLFDEFSGNIPLLVIALCEVSAVSYIYGLKRFGDDIQLMTGKRPNFFWLAMWKYVSPFAMVVILIASIIKMCVGGTTYDAWNSSTADTIALEWPGWCKFLAAFLILTSLLWIPVVAILKRFKIIKWTYEEPASFPEDELKSELELKTPYEPSEWERKIFYWREKC